MIIYDGLFWKHSDCNPLSNMPILGSSLVPIRREKDSIRLNSLFLELGGSLRKEAPRRLNLLVKKKITQDETLDSRTSQNVSFQ